MGSCIVSLAILHGTWLIGSGVQARIDLSSSGSITVQGRVIQIFSLTKEFRYHADLRGCVRNSQDDRVVD